MRRLPRLAAVAALVLTACASVGGLDAGPTWEAPPAALSPARITGWEDRLLTYAVTSTVPGIDSRQITVLTPPGYADPANAGRRYPVLYMHDGQNCLDRDPFGHGGWRAHTTSTDQVTAGKMAPILLVFVDNTRSRAAEYVQGQGAGATTAEAYLDFLQTDVVPFVEKHWRTGPGPANRGLGGSSYGGLISLYGAWTRPGTWGVVMSMSTAFGFDFIGLARLATARRPLRIYLDSGTIDWTGGDDGRAETVVLRDFLISQGWVLGTDLQHVVGQDHNHAENFWRLRLPDAYAWLYPP